MVLCTISIQRSDTVKYSPAMRLTSAPERPLLQGPAGYVTSTVACRLAPKIPGKPARALLRTDVDKWELRGEDSN